MCVIMVADVERPTEEMVRKAFLANDHGAGAAWREDGMVKWRKGLDLKEMQELAASLPIPHVLHFRIQSCGGKSPFLCHPFPIEEDVPLHLDGETLGYVLFHNGHWGAWKDKSLESAVRRNHKIPGGKWSDTRAMAMMAHYYGLGVLDLIDEKAVAFGPETIEMYSTWYKLNNVWCSNLGFNTTTTVYNRGGYMGSREVVDDYSWEGGGAHSAYGGTGRQTGPDSRLPSHYAGGAKQDGKVQAGDAGSKVEGSEADRQAVTKLLGPAGAPGGSTAGESFRTGSETVQEGGAESQEVQEGPEKVREVAVQGEGAPHSSSPGGPAKEQRESIRIDAIVPMKVNGSVNSHPLVQLASTEDMSLLRWTRSFNPKTYRASAGKGINGASSDREARSRDREKGVERVGPM